MKFLSNNQLTTNVTPEETSVINTCNKNAALSEETKKNGKEY